MIRGQKQPWSWIGVWRYCKFRLEFNTSRFIMFHTSIVLVSHGFNLWCKWNCPQCVALFAIHMIGCYSNFSNKFNWRYLSWSSIWLNFSHDIMRWMACIISGTECFETTMHEHNNLLGWVSPITGHMRKCPELTVVRFEEQYRPCVEVRV